MYVQSPERKGEKKRLHLLMVCTQNVQKSGRDSMPKRMQPRWMHDIKVKVNIQNPICTASTPQCNCRITDVDMHGTLYI